MTTKQFFTILLLCAAATICAQTNATAPIFTEMADNVVFHQDSAIVQLIIEQTAGLQRETQKIQGFRVQVFSSNDVKTGQNEAFRVERYMKDATLGIGIYVTFNAPFWKVRLGDCRTKAEADQLCKDLQSLFPDLRTSTYVVKDEIIVAK